MADNLLVINAANVTTAIRAVDLGNGTSLIMMSTPGTVGGTTILTQSAATAGSWALPVVISPNGVNANGGTTSANSAPVVIASDQTAIPSNLRVVGYTALPASVANSTALSMIGDKTGRPQVVFSPRELKASQTGSSATNVEFTIVNAINATTYADIYGLVLANSGSTTTLVNIRYGTGSAILLPFEVPATETRGFMLPSCDALIGSLSTANVSWTAQCASTTVMSITAFYVKNLV